MDTVLLPITLVFKDVLQTAYHAQIHLSVKFVQMVTQQIVMVNAFLVYQIVEDVQALNKQFVYLVDKDFS